MKSFSLAVFKLVVGLTVGLCGFLAINSNPFWEILLFWILFWAALDLYVALDRISRHYR